MKLVFTELNHCREIQSSAIVLLVEFLTPTLLKNSHFFDMEEFEYWWSRLLKRMSRSSDRWRLNLCLLSLPGTHNTFVLS